jgi:hypothetical protein
MRILLGHFVFLCRLVRWDDIAAAGQDRQRTGGPCRRSGNDGGAAARRAGLRRIPHDDQPTWLAAYGAFSLVGGIILLAASTWVWWLAAGDLITSLFEGSPAEILLGLYVVVPFAMAVVLSTVGLALEVLVKPVSYQADPTSIG